MLVSRGCSITEMRTKPPVKDYLSDEDLTYFTYSREAIVEIFRINQICQDDEVLLPDYLCSTVIESILPFTKKIAFYNIDHDLKHKHSEISKLLTSKTKLILFVDYFGVETQLERSLQEILENINVIVIKDASHSFLSLVDRNFGRDYNCDYLISSIYKNLPMQVGAIGIGSFNGRTDFISLSAFLTRTLVLLAKNIIAVFGLNWWRNKSICQMSIAKETKAKRFGGTNISTWYEILLSKLDLDQIINNRKVLAGQFTTFFTGKSICRPVFSGEDINQNVLQDYPLYFHNQADRDSILKLLVSNSIDAYTWPTFHRINSKNDLWSKVLLVPLNKKVLKIFEDV